MPVVTDWVYDLETYPNCFSMSIVRADKKFSRRYEVSFRKNEVEGIFKCLDYLSNNDHRMIGFNNLGFDYPILHKLLKLKEDGKLPVRGETIAKRMYEYAQEQVESGRKTGFPSTVPEAEHYVTQVDLYKIHHFDNKAKATSLKLIEFNMRSETIEDLPYEIGRELTSDEIDKLLDYNDHDTNKTRDFYDATLPMLTFREVLTEKYGRNFLNHNDTKIGKDYFIMRLDEAGIHTKKKDGDRNVLIQTKRPIIKLKDCLFDYYDFQTPEFQSVLEWFGNQRITETKGVFSDLDEHQLMNVAQYAEMDIKKEKIKCSSNDGPTDNELISYYKKHPKGWVEAKELKAKKKGITQFSYYFCHKEAGNLNVVLNGFRFDFGTGGIHGSITDKIARATKDYTIVDADVESMYPNLGISNRVYPEHLTEKFCDIYADVFEQRKSFPKGTPENAMLKLALNGVYGDSNNKFSPFYDPMYTMKITINGQLSLCLLAEKLMLGIPKLKLIQVNTDGITVALPIGWEDEYKEICDQWQKQVKLKLEFADYSKMIIRDVNNYIAVYTNGKVKRKGAYQYEGLGWHQNQGGLVIPKAAEAAMLHDVCLDEYVRNHKNIFDFMLRTKVPRSSKLVLVYNDGTEVVQQNIARYYPSRSGGKLVKLMPPLPDSDPQSLKGSGLGTGEFRRISIESQWNVKVCNNMKDFTDDIDYDYYVQEAKKLIVPAIPGTVHSSDQLEEQSNE